MTCKQRYSFPSCVLSSSLYRYLLERRLLCHGIAPLVPQHPLSEKWKLWASSTDAVVAAVAELSCTVEKEEGKEFSARSNKESILSWQRTVDHCTRPAPLRVFLESPQIRDCCSEKLVTRPRRWNFVCHRLFCAGRTLQDVVLRRQKPPTLSESTQGRQAFPARYFHF